MSRRVFAIVGLVAGLSCLLIYACTPGFNPDVDEPAAEVRVDPATLDFGDVAVGQSLVERFKIYNETAGGITLLSVSISAEDTAFQLISPPGDDFALGAGQDRTVNVEFYPAAEQESQAMVVIETDHADYPTLEVELYGCSDPAGCDGPSDDDDVTDDDDDDDDDDVTDDDDDDTGDECGELDVDPTTIVFPMVAIGHVSTETVTLTNTGGDPVEITSVTASSGDFGYQGITPPTTLQAGGSLQFSARFEPTVAGTINGSLTIGSCDGEATITLTGTGEDECDPCTPDIEVTPGSIDFGTLTGGSATASFTVSNTGVDPLHLTSISGTSSVAGGTVSIVAGNTTATIQPGSVEYFTIEWMPGELFPGQGCLDALGSGTAWITINSDDPDEATVLIDLDGCCDAATGGSFCTYGDLVTLLMCMSSAPCGDPLTALLYCTLGLPC